MRKRRRLGGGVVDLRSYIRLSPEKTPLARHGSVKGNRDEMDKSFTPDRYY